MTETRQLSAPADFDIPGWRELAWDLPGTSYFQSPEWIAAWWGTIAGRPDTTAATWRAADGALEAIAVVSQVRERLHHALPLSISYQTNAGSGVGAADHIGLLVRPGREGDVAGWLSSQPGSQLYRNVPPGAAYLPAGAVDHGATACPRLAIPPGDEPIGRSAKYRKRLRRNSRVLRDRGLEFRAVAGPDITDEMVSRLMEMHDVRSDDMGWGSTFTEERIEFHRQLIAAAEVGRGPGMMIATRDETIVGVLYGFWWDGSFSYFQTGWDKDWWELSLGSALVYEMVLHAREQGATLFDFLRGPEEYKYRFGAEDHVDTDWLVAKGVSGALLKLKARLR